MRSWFGSIVLILLAAFVAWAVYDAVSGRIASADSARDEAIAIAERASGHAAALDSAAQVQSDSAAYWRTIADTIRRNVVRIVTKIEEVPVPAECEPYTAPRDTLAELLERENAVLREAERQANEAAATYRLRGDIAIAAVDSMRTLIEGIRTPSRLVIGPGISYGITLDDEPRRSTTVGLNATVRIYPIDIIRVIRWAF